MLAVHAHWEDIFPNSGKGQKMRVITRAYGDEPLDRVTSGCAHGIVFIVNPNVNRALDDLESSGVGFPSCCVYEYSDSLLQELRSAWAMEDREALETLWARATLASVKEAA